MDAIPPTSQESSHYPLEPISGSTLFDIEKTRREILSRKGTLQTGCREVDGQVLIDGFERGAVVGLSAEDIDVGLLLALQTIAYNLVNGPDGKPALRRVVIITTLATPVMLPKLRDVIKAQVQSKLGLGHADINIQTRRCLECISVSRVFDIEGLWEVLNEVEMGSSDSSPKTADGTVEETAADRTRTPSPPPAPPEEPESSPLSSPPASSPITELPPLRSRRVEKTEILDSEDDEELSPVASDPPDLPAFTVPLVAEDEEEEEEDPALPGPPSESDKHDANDDKASKEQEDDDSNTPGMILITHFSTLLSALFTQKDKSSAHSTLQLLSSHLRYLSRSVGPLIMLLNNTTSTATTTTAIVGGGEGSSATTPNAPSGRRPLDPTLRSIFNAPPPSHVGYGYGPGSAALSRKNKPAFGLTFTQFLDLHLLCTRVPKTRADAEALFAPPGRGRQVVRYAWVVEVLLDESMYWSEMVGGRGRRVDREQRWGVVDVKDGVMVVDAFQMEERTVNTEMFRLNAGFGGRRV